MSSYVSRGSKAEEDNDLNDLIKDDSDSSFAVRT